MVLLASSVTMNSAPIMGSTTLLHSQQQQLHKPLLQLPNSGINSHSLSFPYLSTRGFGVASPSLKTSSVAVTVAADTTQPTSSDQDQTSKKYYFVVANAKFMLDEEEHFQEQLFERRRYYKEQGKEEDFWLVVEPKFLDKFPNITKRLKRPAVALVSTNGPWITFMKLRLDRVLSESHEADSLEEALAYNPTKIEFEKPEKWLAPYTKYEYGWWEAFLPPGSQQPQA